MRHRRSVPTAGAPERGARVAAAASVLVMVCSAGALVTAVGAQPVAPDQRRTLPHPVPKAGADSAAASPTPVSGPATSTASGTAPRPWRAVLVELDHRRARAYARAEPRLLRSVYRPGAAALRRDQDLLRRYHRHGLRVRGLRMHVGRVRVRQRLPNKVVLAVHDRIAAGMVVGAGQRRGLKPSALRHYRIVLHRAPGQGWCISAVRRSDA